MKKDYLILLAFCIFNVTKSLGDGPEPIDFNLCITTPDNVDDFVDCNNVIARMYGPVIYQWMTNCHSDSEKGDADRLLKVNFDGDWIANNNWSTLEDLQDDPTYDNKPYAYYAVIWTDNFWLITYSFYYARDHAKDGLCSDDEHEGDVTKIFLVVKRPESEDDNFRDLLKGYSTHKDNVNCIDVEQSNDSYDDFNAVIGTDLAEVEGVDGIHPLVSSAAGSHHQYKTYTKGFKDDLNQCKVRPTALTEYLPSPSNIPSNLTELDFPSGCGSCDFDAPVHIFLVENCRNETEFYGLIDLFDIEEGLWEQRINSDMFTHFDEPHNFDKQKFRCDNGGGCNPPVANAAPGAPWKGETGMNPLLAVRNNFSNSFCDGTSFEDCHYLYNPQLCGQYEIFKQDFMINDDGVRVRNPAIEGTDFILRLKFGTPPYYPLRPEAKVIWTFDLPGDIPAGDVSCEGCDEKLSIITLTISNADYHSSGTSNFFVHAETEKALLECPEKESDTYELKVTPDALIVNTTCTSTSFEIDPDYHVDGNTYEWIFPHQPEISIEPPISDGGVSISIPAPSEAELEDVEDYIVTIADVDYLPYLVKVRHLTSDFQEDLVGLMKILDCATGLNLMLYPNPSTDILHLEFSGQQIEKQKNFDLTIVDHQLNPIRKINCPSANGTINVSDLDAGLYYLYTITDEGQIVSKKFCVGH